jgi:hypothetical protein
MAFLFIPTAACSNKCLGTSLAGVSQNAQVAMGFVLCCCAGACSCCGCGRVTTKGSEVKWRDADLVRRSRSCLVYIGMPCGCVKECTGSNGLCAVLLCGCVLVRCCGCGVLTTK